MLAQPKGQVIIYGLGLGGRGGGGKAGVVGGFVDLGLNTVRYSRSHLQMLFNLSDPPSYLFITFVTLPPVQRFCTYIHLSKCIIYCFTRSISSYYVLTE